MVRLYVCVWGAVSSNWNRNLLELISSLVKVAGFKSSPHISNTLRKKLGRQILFTVSMMAMVVVVMVVLVAAREMPQKLRELVILAEG